MSWVTKIFKLSKISNLTLLKQTNLKLKKRTVQGGRQFVVKILCSHRPDSWVKNPITLEKYHCNWCYTEERNKYVFFHLSMFLLLSHLRAHITFWRWKRHGRFHYCFAFFSLGDRFDFDYIACRSVGTWFM